MHAEAHAAILLALCSNFARRNNVLAIGVHSAVKMPVLHRAGIRSGLGAALSQSQAVADRCTLSQRRPIYFGNSALSK